VDDDSDLHRHLRRRELAAVVDERTVSCLGTSLRL